MSVFLLSPSTQKYDWGKLGLESRVAQLAQASGATIDQGSPYAELWMGTHPTSPSYLAKSPDTLLSAHLEVNPQLINEPSGYLPFLLKVLSIRKALSIQTHPSKEMAKLLHAERGDIYKDDNHKPEMALALTPFEALVGFAPIPTIAKNLAATPELAALVPSHILAAFNVSVNADSTSATVKSALRDLFKYIMTASSSLVSEQLEKLLVRYQQEKTGDKLAKLVQTLAEAYPNDVGVFCVFLLNYVELKPAEAVFLGAGEPHAYLSGDIIECMAASDNVIRAGLTPKLRDVPNLIAGLTYISADSSKHHVFPSPFSETGKSTLYDPPIEEFSVVRVVVDQTNEKHRAVDGPSVAVITEGKGSVKWKEGEIELKMGDVFFIGKGVEAEFSGDGLVVYRAFCEGEV